MAQPVPAPCGVPSALGADIWVQGAGLMTVGQEGLTEQKYQYKDCLTFKTKHVL